MDKVAEKLREQRPLLRSYTTDMTSVEQSLASGELVAAMTWNASATTLKKQGVPVEFMKPKEGMLTWACGFVMLKDAKNVDLAYDFINSRLEADFGQIADHSLWLWQRLERRLRRRAEGGARQAAAAGRSGSDAEEHDLHRADEAE